MGKRLYRSKSDRKIAGICGGLGEYLSIDPTIVRIIVFILFLLTMPLATLIYFACIIIIPEDDGFINTSYKER